MGGPVPLIEAARQAEVSDSGTLVYTQRTTSATAPGRTLVWIDRQGKEEPLAAAAGEYSYFRISPDGNRVALTVGSGLNADVWIWDIVRETLTRLTIEEGLDQVPLSTPDGKHRSGREAWFGIRPNARPIFLVERRKDFGAGGGYSPLFADGRLSKSGHENEDFLNLEDSYED